VVFKTAHVLLGCEKQKLVSYQMNNIVIVRYEQTLCAVVQIEQSKLSQSMHLATASSFALQLVQINPLKLESDADLFRNIGSNCKELNPRSPTLCIEIFFCFVMRLNFIIRMYNIITAVSCLHMGQVIVVFVFFLAAKIAFSLDSSLSNSNRSFTQISHRT